MDLYTNYDVLKTYFLCIILRTLKYVLIYLVFGKMGVS
jgi:hypothetical protein